MWSDFDRYVRNRYPSGKYAQWVNEFNTKYAYNVDPATANQWLYWAGGLPGIGGFLQANAEYSEFNDYLRNRGISWADVKYPAKRGVNFGRGFSSGFNFVSKNLDWLY